MFTDKCPHGDTVGSCTECSIQSPVVDLCRTIVSLQDEINRLKSGQWTREEIHNICHNLHDTVGPTEFAEACAAEQRKIYGCAPHADALADEKAKAVFCSRCGNLIEETLT